MANKSIFSKIHGRMAPAGNTVNEAGGKAYSLSAKEALAQLAATGCFNGTFYATADEQLEKVITLCRNIEPGFIAKTALYARQAGYMKDMPALLCAILTVRDIELFERVAPVVLDNAKMVRVFTQIVRSGVVGRKSLGTCPKRFIQEWIYNLSDDQLFRSSVGQDPSIADLIKMVHPRPANASRAALYAYLIGKDYKAEELPGLVKQFEAFKARAHELAKSKTKGFELFRKGKKVKYEVQVPAVPFQFLTALPLGKMEWQAIARNASWQMTRMNLNTFARHGVFEDEDLVSMIADRLRDPVKVAQARVFPYQLLAAYKSAGSGIPTKVKNALQDAMEVAVENVPSVSGNIVVCPDSSGSMTSPVTGYRQGSTTAVTCVEVAALAAAAFLRKNENAEVNPFMHDVIPVTLNPRDSVMTNATKLSNLGFGGTDCSAPLAELNRRKAKPDLVVFISDNESWVDSAPRRRGTPVMREWEALKARHPSAKLVCIDIQPYVTAQAVTREDILNIGGFSDAVFSAVASFAEAPSDRGFWINAIEDLYIP